MSELKFSFDNWGDKELETYLISLNGIKEVKIDNEKNLDIYLKYDSNLISPKVIFMEISLFLNFRKIPCMVSFNKYSKTNTSTYTITRKDICCEFCYNGAIEDLFNINGIEKVEGNYYTDFLLKHIEERDLVKINIEYNPDILSIEDLQKIEKDLNI